MEDMDLLFGLAGLALVEVARAWCLGNCVATARVGRPSLCPSFIMSTILISPYFPVLQNLRNCLSFAITCICNLHQVIQFTVYTFFSPRVDHITGCNFSAVKIRFQHSYILRKVSGLFEDDAGLLFEFGRVCQELNMHEIEKSSLVVCHFVAWQAA